LVKTQLFIKVGKKARAKLPISIENFLISQLEEVLELPKVQLKSENYEILLHSTDHSLVKNGSILILFTFFSIYIQNASPFA
jgi:hypothetical protein